MKQDTQLALEQKFPDLTEAETYAAHRAQLRARLKSQCCRCAACGGPLTLAEEETGFGCVNCYRRRIAQDWYGSQELLGRSDEILF